MNALRFLRIVGWLEGLSFLFLLLVAMPLKYALHLPSAVRVAGSIHGLLFLLFVSVLFRVAVEREWPFRRSLGLLGASLLPFGPLVLDRALRSEIEADAVTVTKG